jgi:hypothetical protein
MMQKYTKLESIANFSVLLATFRSYTQAGILTTELSAKSCTSIY